MIKGTLGTMCILLLFPIICLSFVTLSLTIALTTVLWMPIVTVIFHLFMVTVYDFDSPDPLRRNR